MSFMCWWPQRWMQDCRWGLLRVERGRIPSWPFWPCCFGCSSGCDYFSGCKHTLLALVQPFINQHPQVLLQRAALSLFIPQPVLIVGLSLSMCSTSHLVLLNHMRFPCATFLSLCRSLWMPSQAPGVLTASLSLVSAAEWLWAHSVPLSMAFWNFWIAPEAVWVPEGQHLSLVPIVTPLTLPSSCPCPANSLSTKQSINQICMSPVQRKVFWGTMSMVLQKSR